MSKLTRKTTTLETDDRSSTVLPPFFFVRPRINYLKKGKNNLIFNSAGNQRLNFHHFMYMTKARHLTLTLKRTHKRKCCV